MTLHTDVTTRLRVSLLILRLSVFLVWLMWTVDKFINPQHAALVYSSFYAIDGLSAGISYLVGAAQLVLIVAFLIGYKRTYTYGAVLVMQLIPTLASYSRYLDPWEGTNLLFYAAWPMLAAAVVLFVLRSEDTLFSLAPAGPALEPDDNRPPLNAD